MIQPSPRSLSRSNAHLNPRTCPNPIRTRPAPHHARYGHRPDPASQRHARRRAGQTAPRRHGLGKPCDACHQQRQKERLCYFSIGAWHALEIYFAQRHDGATGRALGSLPMFSRHDRGCGPIPKPLSTEIAERRFEELCKRAKLPNRVTPHTLRHSFATRVLSTTGDLALVQESLGHASPVTTRVYARVSQARIRAAISETFDELPN